MLLEREEQLQILDEVRLSISRSGGRIVFVAGEAGIGKSSLIADFLSSLGPETRKVIGLCDPLITPRPLGPIRDIAAGLSGSTQIRDEEAMLFGGLVEHLSSLREPVVLVIEDLHWADDRTLDWLKFIGRRIAMLPLLLVCSYRDDQLAGYHPLRSAMGEIVPARKKQINLAPLSLDAVQTLVGSTRLAPNRLLDITGGNPFFLTELLAQSADGSKVPQTIGDAVDARLAGLPQDVVRLLEYVSCWPGAIPSGILLALPLPDGYGTLTQAIEKGLLIESGGRLSFRHEIARIAIYDRLSHPRRVEAHRCFLDHLCNREDGAQPLDMIVHHARGAEHEQLLLRYAPLAADNAASLGAHREAARFLEHVLPLADSLDLEQAAEICERWAYEAGLSLGIDADVISSRRKAVELWRKAGNENRVGENLRWLSRLHWYRGEAEEAKRYIEEAIEVLENNASATEWAKAKAYALRAQYHMLQDEMSEAVTWGRRALTFAQAVEDVETCTHALNTVGSAMLFRGDPEGETLLRESLRISLENGFDEQAARVYTNLSECLIEMRALDRAEDLIDAGIRFDSAHDLDAWTYYLIGRKAQLRLEQGRFDEAVTIARGVLGQENQTLLMRMPAQIVLARSLLRLGDAAAGEALQQALVSAEKIGEPQYLTVLKIAEIEQSVLAGTSETAAQAWDWLCSLDPRLLSPRKLGEAMFWARIAELPLKSTSAPVLPEPVRLLLEGKAEEAGLAFQMESSDYLAAWSFAATGKAERLQEADELFRSMGAMAARRWLRSREGGSGLPPLQRGPYKSSRNHPYGLTAKEQTVLRLLVEGNSNAAIAETLSRSRRTIENHVSSILSKLQAKDRVEVLLRSQSEPWIVVAEDETDVEIEYSSHEN
ncbi:ATP-binding protein [Roseibium aggregatum]|uniref:ATP-binding protein n=1 Tax=Roseibium aggregatum TaxID=187304 RepID=UPI00226C5444|nr:AAA family ATPase [Roseibium aggregatum]